MRRETTVSRRELLGLRLRRDEVDHVGYTACMSTAWDGVDRTPLERALAPVHELLAAEGEIVAAFDIAYRSPPIATIQALLRPGARVALAAWTPRGLPGALEEHVGRPPGIPSPALWGHEPRARRRLQPLLDDLVIRTRTVTLEFPSPDALYEQLVAPRHRPALRPAFDRLLAATNNRPPEAVINARYLLVTGIAR